MRGFDTVPMVDLVLGTLDRESLEMPGVRPDRHFFGIQESNGSRR
jgi:hypothetical protein